MAEVKRYYWLKLKRDFFKRHDIRIVEAMPNGKDYILFYLKLLLESIDHNGELRFSETIPYDDNMLSVITNTNVDIVRSARKIFTELGMMELLSDSTIYMREVEKLIGSETNYAEKKRRQRERQKLAEGDNVPLIEDNVSHVSRQRYPEKEIDIEIDKDIDKEREYIPMGELPPTHPSPQKSTRFVPPTVEEVKAYCEERRNSVDPIAFWNFYAGKGWMVGKSKMKNWKSAIITWEQREKGEAKKNNSAYSQRDAKEKAAAYVTVEL